MAPRLSRPRTVQRWEPAPGFVLVANEVYINRLELFWICNISIQQPARPNQASDKADVSKAAKSTDGEKVKDPGLPRSFYINGSLETWSVTGCYW
jgi:hypothetical protein